MKYPLPAGNYTFNASAKTITFANTVPASIANIMHVTNVTRGVIYFQPQAGAAFTGTYSSPTLTLVVSTSGHSDNDQLLIVYDDGAGPLTDTQLRATAVPVAPNVQQGGGAITASTTRVTLATDGPGVANLASIAGLSIPAHDYIALSYTGTNLTGVVYKTGGSGGTTVGTLTLAYNGSNQLTSVTRS